VGIGVVPEAWHSAFTEVLQVGVASLITSGGDNARVFSNAYYDGAYKRIGTGYAHSYEQTGGTHRWFSAASGSADSSISWAESMRIDSSGNLLVGTTDAAVGVGNTNTGLSLQGGGFAAISRTGTSGQPTLTVNKNTNDGELVGFYKDGSAVGVIATWDGEIAIGRLNCALLFDDDANRIKPHSVSSNTVRDNALDMGGPSARFDDIYATNGTIQTSDRNEKQNIEALSDAEQRVAVAAKGLLRKFRWKSSVEENGDDARIHFGIIAQDLQDAFTAEGLDAGRYAMFISSTWTDEETGEERTRLGVRYSELLAFIISAI
jgi:hypothetical protein